MLPPSRPRSRPSWAWLASATSSAPSPSSSPSSTTLSLHPLRHFSVLPAPRRRFDYKMQNDGHQYIKFHRGKPPPSSPYWSQISRLSPSKAAPGQDPRPAQSSSSASSSSEDPSTSTASSVYPFSNAASRPNPNARAPLFATKPLKPSRKGAQLIFRNQPWDAQSRDHSRPWSGRQGETAEASRTRWGSDQAAGEKQDSHSHPSGSALASSQQGDEGEPDHGNLPAWAEDDSSGTPEPDSVYPPRSLVDLVRRLTSFYANPDSALDIQPSHRNPDSLRSEILFHPACLSLPSSLSPADASRFYYERLKLFGDAQDASLCRDVVARMKREGVGLDINGLNMALKAAAMRGDVGLAREALALDAQNSRAQRNSTAGFPEPTSSGQSQLSDDAYEEPGQEADSSTTTTTTKNNWFKHAMLQTFHWDTQTFQYLFTLYTQSGSLEMALSLLGLASSQHPPAFLARVLSPATQEALITLAMKSGEVRLATDLAHWFDGGMSLRRVEGSTWMKVLRGAAADDWFPGIKVAWRRAVTNARLTPDEGLLISVINSASRWRDPEFIVEVLIDFFPDYQGPGSRFGEDPPHRRIARKAAAVEREGEAPKDVLPWSPDLQEVHLAPLFDAYAGASKFKPAMRTLSYMAHIGLPTLGVSALSSLLMSASFNSFTLEKAIRVYEEIGGREVGGLGVSTSAMNALIAAANRLVETDKALRIYHGRARLRGVKPFRGAEEADTSSPNSSSSSGSSQTSEAGEADEESSSESTPPTSTSSADAEPPRLSRREIATTSIDPSISSSSPSDWPSPLSLPGPTPDVDTINLLLTSAINVRDRRLGRRILSDLNQLQIVANAVTYERAIVLCLTDESRDGAGSGGGAWASGVVGEGEQAGWRDGFRLLEEAKERGLTPSRPTYVALLARCLREKDPRSRRLEMEMKAVGYPAMDEYERRRLALDVLE